MPCHTRSHGPAAPVLSDTGRTPSFSRAAIFGGKKRISRDVKRESFEKTPIVHKSPAEQLLKTEGISITVVEGGVETLRSTVDVHTPTENGSRSEKGVDVNGGVTEIDGTAMQRADSNNSNAERDSGKDLGGPDDEIPPMEQKQTPPIGQSVPLNKANTRMPPPRLMNPRMDNRGSKPRMPTHERRVSIPPPSPREDGRRPPIRRPYPDGRQENRPPGPSRHNSENRNSTFDLSLPMPAPPEGTYTVRVLPEQKTCMTGHRNCIRSANVHHRIKCMTCLTNAANERWMCSFCSLRICSRCRTEFAAGKTFDQVLQKAAAEGWKMQPGANPSRPTDSGAWETANRIEVGSRSITQRPQNDHNRRSPMPVRGPDMNTRGPRPPQMHGPSVATGQPPMITRSSMGPMGPPMDGPKSPLSQVSSPPMDAPKPDIPKPDILSPDSLKPDSKITLDEATDSKVSLPDVPAVNEPAPSPPPPSSNGTVLLDGSSVGGLSQIAPTATKTTTVSGQSERKRGFFGRLFGGRETKETSKLKKGGSGKGGVK